MRKLLAKLVLLFVAGFGLSMSAQTLTEKINAILADPALTGATYTMLVENDSGSTVLYQNNPTTGKAPASNTKMFTTSAAFALLGTNHYFETRIYCDGTLANGVLTGNLNLVSEHDMTWNTSVFSGNARKPLDFIVTKLKALGLTAVTGNVQCYGVCYYNRSSTSTDHKTESATSYNGDAAVAFRSALTNQGVTISGTSVGQSGFTPPGTLFYTHKSSDLTYGGKPLQLDIACIPLLKVSHNVMADELLWHIGYKLNGNNPNFNTFSAGRDKVLAWMSGTAGIDTSGIVMNDGSGLSSGNRFSAQQTVRLTRYMLSHFPTWDDGLPIGCVDGTISGRFCGTDGSGQVHAKTGSLSISIALSGYINNKYNGQRYLFSFIANQSSGIDQDAARDALDNATILLGARSFSTAPQIYAVTNNTTGGLTVAWSNDGYIRTGYRVYWSSNNVDFTPINVTSGIQSLPQSLPPDTKRYYKVTVVNGTNESIASRVYGAQASTTRPFILIVDGYDRWQSQTSENPNALNHAFAAVTGQSISGPAFDTAHHNQVLSGAVPLSNYSTVIWELGEESTADETFSTAEQALVTTYLNGGGNLFVSGAEIGWDLDRTSGTTPLPITADHDFYHNQLRAVLNNDDSATYSFSALPTGIFAGNSPSGFDNGSFGGPNLDFPDILTPTNGSVAALTYVGGLGGNAALTYDGSLGGGKLVNFGFGFEQITNAAARDAYMSDILRFFGLIDPPRVSAIPMLSDPTKVVLNWTASSGLRYRLQFSTNLSTATWTDVLPDITASSTVVTVTNNLDANQKFFRVLQLN